MKTLIFIIFFLVPLALASDTQFITDYSGDTQLFSGISGDTQFNYPEAFIAEEGGGGGDGGSGGSGGGGGGGGGGGAKPEQGNATVNITEELLKKEEIILSNATITQKAKSYLLKKNSYIKKIPNLWLLLTAYIILAGYIYIMTRKIMKPIVSLSLALTIPLIAITTYVVILLL